MPIGDAQDEVLVIYPTFYSIVGLRNNYARRGVSLTMGFQAEGVPALSLTSRVTSLSFCFVPPPHIVSLTLGLVGRAGQTLRGSMWHPAAAACPPFDHPGCGPSQALAASAPRLGVCSALGTHSVLFLESKHNPVLPPTCLLYTSDAADE